MRHAIVASRCNNDGITTDGAFDTTDYSSKLCAAKILSRGQFPIAKVETKDDWPFTSSLPIGLTIV